MNITNLDVYSSDGDRVGRIIEEVTDQANQSRYALVSLDDGANHKQVLLPAERFTVNANAHRVDVRGLSTSQMYQLPSSQQNQGADASSSSFSNVQSGQSYSSTQLAGMAVLENDMPLENEVPLEGPIAIERGRRIEGIEQAGQPTHASTNLANVSPPDTLEDNSALDTLEFEAVNSSEQVVENHTIQLLEERIVSDRQRRKVGEVIIRKAIETRMVEVPVRREVLIVEQAGSDRQALATIDLSKETLAENQIGDRFTSATSSFAASTETEAKHQTVQYVPVKTAQKLLDSVANRADTEVTRVMLIFEEDSVQQSYERWLERQYTQHPIGSETATQSSYQSDISQRSVNTQL